MHTTQICLGNGASNRPITGARKHTKMNETAIHNRANSHPARHPARHISITAESATDFFEHLFMGEHITAEQWHVIQSVRCLAKAGRRSQGVRVRLHSHSQYWGMPHLPPCEGPTNAAAERRWKLFVLYLKPFVEHHQVDRTLADLLIHGGHVTWAGDPIYAGARGGGACEGNGAAAGLPSKTTRRRADHPHAGFTINAIHHAVHVIDYVFEKTVRRR